MKGLRIVVMLALVFVVSAPLFAGPAQTMDTSALEYATSGNGNLCTDIWGCPACVSNIEMTKAMCVKVHFKDGSCKCGNPKGVTEFGAVCGILYGTCKMLF
jgi:hypothetical protein